MKQSLPHKAPSFHVLPLVHVWRTVAWLYALGALLPLWWLVVTAFQPEGVNIEHFPRNLGWFEAPPSLQTWHTLWHSPGLVTVLLHSMAVTLLTAGCNVGSSLILAYVLERKLLKKYTSWLYSIVLAATSIPFQVLLIPLFLEMNTLGLTDTPEGMLPAFLALVLPFAFSGFGVFYLRAALKSCPTTLEEAAMLDGASQGYILWHVVRPQLKPTLWSLFTLSCIATWGEFLWPNVVLIEPEHLTLPIFLARLQQTMGDQWRLLAAASLLSTLPCLMVFLWVQRRMVSTHQGSALK